MSNPQTLVYECSRGNAAVKITNNEWINEFSEGIKLEKGDQIKLLGRFFYSRERSRRPDRNITRRNSQYRV